MNILPGIILSISTTQVARNAGLSHHTGLLYNFVKVENTGIFF
jgi:hypothetical protein